MLVKTKQLKWKAARKVKIEIKWAYFDRNDMC